MLLNEYSKSPNSVYKVNIYIKSWFCTHTHGKDLNGHAPKVPLGISLKRRVELVKIKED